jgi:hypothetical protein
MTFFSSRNLIVIVATGCSALVVLLLIGQDIAAAVSKLVASSAFVALAIQVGGLRSNYGRLILLGLVFSWFGDASLIGETQTLFLLGLGAFLLAHVTYIAAFIVKGVDAKWTASAALPIAAIALAVSAWLAPHVQPGDQFDGYRSIRDAWTWRVDLDPHRRRFVLFVRSFGCCIAPRADRPSDLYLGPAAVLCRSGLFGAQHLTVAVPLRYACKTLYEKIDERPDPIRKVSRRRIYRMG